MSAAVAAAPASFQSAWEGALAELEVDVTAAEQLLQAIHGGAAFDDVPAGPGSWAPPTGLGPLPESLAERAHLVLARQLAVSERMAQAAVLSRQQLELDRRMRPELPASRPMFVDRAV